MMGTTFCYVIILFAKLRSDGRPGNNHSSADIGHLWLSVLESSSFEDHPRPGYRNQGKPHSVFGNPGSLYEESSWDLGHLLLHLLVEGKKFNFLADSMTRIFMANLGKVR
jgi:hypothetical protein